MNEEQMMQQGGAEATPEQVMGAQEEQRQAQMQAIAAQAPQPEKPYSYKEIKKMADSMRDFVKKIDPEQDLGEYIAPEGESKLDAQLPAEIFVPYVAIMAFISSLEGFEKYVFKPEELKSDTGLKMAKANFDRMGKDKKLVKKLQEGSEPPKQEEEEEEKMSEAEMRMAQQPGEMSPEDQEIMGMM